MKNFPIEVIPHQTEDEKLIQTLKKQVTNRKVELYKLSNDPSIPPFDKLRRKLELSTELEFNTSKLKSIRDLNKKEGCKENHVHDYGRRKGIQNLQSNLHFLKQQLSSSRIELILEQIKSPENAKLIGILSHFVYWAVFGGFNELFLDNYHKKSLLITLLQQL